MLPFKWLYFCSCKDLSRKKSGKRTLIRIPALLPLFPGLHLQGLKQVRHKVERIALESIRIEQGSPFISILVSRWLFNGLTGHRLSENPSESRQL